MTRRFSFDPSRLTMNLFNPVQRVLLLTVTSLALVTSPSTGVTYAAAPAKQDPVFADAASAAADPDFAVQGEYTGTGRAIQVVAAGEGEFQIVIYEGGLPGDGWRGDPPRRIDGDADVVDGLIDSMDLKKVVRTSPTLGAKPPSGATILFDGTDASLAEHWQEGARKTNDGLLIQGATTKVTFTDYALHLEFQTPFQPKATGQGRGNSGLYHQGRYENQILDSFGLEGTKNETGSLYDLRAPDLNACFPPLTWQTYDVVFTAARFDESGKKTADARMTVRLNGIVVQNDIAAASSTRAAPMGESDTPGPIYLQDHGNPVRFRNIWVMPRDAEREARRPHVPGFERFYGTAASPAEIAMGGEVLITNLGCVNCHQGASVAWQPLVGPNLSDVASRIRPDFLARWIAAPHDLKPGTTMPNLLAGMQAEERQRAANAITSYLLSRSDAKDYSDRVGDQQSAERGNTLFHTVGCTACHSPQNGTDAPDATSVPFADLNAKYTLVSLASFLQNPHAVRPSGRMPRLAADAGEARDLATYLLRDSVVVPGMQLFLRTVYRGNWDNLPDFETLEPVGEPTTVTGLTFDGIRPLNNFAAVYEGYLQIKTAGSYRFTIGSDDGSRLLIDGREVVRVDGVHPYQQKDDKVELQPGVHRLRVEYFEGGGEERLTLEVDGPDFGKADVSAFVTQDPTGNVDQELVASNFVVDPSLIDEGARLFATVGCANCHELKIDGQRVPSKLEVRKLASIRNPRTRNYLQGCIAENVPAGLPDYQLTGLQQTAIRTALGTPVEPLDDATLVHATMVSANCYACHTRDGIGGPESARDAFFQTTTMEMGNEGRVPPPLTGVGDKLQDRYVSQTLENGANERPYMKTRMPGFGYDHLRPLHDAINRLDRKTEAQIPDHGDFAARSKADGRSLVGNDGLACIKCHTFGGKGTSGIQAIDMLKMTDRLREDWFHRYLLAPQTYRPGTRMPASFPDGVSVLKTIADGNPGYQIDAMWQYLLDGKNAKIPGGLVPGAIELVPKERAIIYRNFLTDLTPRGIAVGYPEEVHLAWDANEMALRKIWQNQFLDASLHWQGRGPGQLGPLGDLVVDVDTKAPLAVLGSIDAAWPEKTDDTNGYRFLGYRLDSVGRPTFRYRMGQATVSDTCVPQKPTDGAAGPELKTLRRVLEIKEVPENLVLRVATGSIETLGDETYRINDTYVVQVEGVRMQVVDVAGRQELRAMIPATDSQTIIQSIRW
jgi:cytochrome c2